MHAASVSPTVTPASAHAVLSVLGLTCLAATLAAALTFALVQLSPEARSGAVLLLVWLLLTTCLFPGLRWLLGTRRTVPIFEGICLSYAAQYAVPALLLPNEFVTIYGTDIFSESDLASALLIVLLGLLAMVATHGLLLGSRLARRIPSVDLGLDQRALGVYLPCAIVGGAVLTAAETVGVGPAGDSGFAALFRLLANQLAVAVAILAYLVLGGRAKQPGYAVLLGVAAVVSVLVGMATSMLESVFTIPIIIAIIGLQQRKRFVGVLAVAIISVYLLLLQPLKFEYRARLAVARTAPSLVERLGLWSDVAQAHFERSSGDQSPDTLLTTSRGSLTRLDFIHILAHVQALTPSVIRHYGGSTYSYFVVGWIPRLVWPDKPIAHEANIEMILSYGLIMESELQTTMMSLGTVAEAYANFGQVGIVAFLALQGVVLALCSHVFSGRGSIGAQAVLLSVLVTFFNGISSSTAILYGGLVQNLLANALLLWFLSGRQRFGQRGRAPSLPVSPVLAGSVVAGSPSQP